jgi:hypothetical protein
MGNEESTYDIIGEKEDPSLPKINSFHSKGKPYGVMIEIKLNGKYPDKWAYWRISDLRNGAKSMWKFYTQIYGNNLEFKLCLARMENKKEEIYLEFPLRYSSESNVYTTVLKGSTEGKAVKLELHGDNIHCQKIENLKLNQKFVIWGFIKFDDQDKIPIAF